MNADAPNYARVFQTDALPGFACVQGFIDAVAMREIAANAGFAHANVNHIRIGFADGNRADGAGAEALSVADRFPIHAAVRGFINAAAYATEIIHIRLGNAASHRNRTPATKGADVAPAQTSEG